ncbi:hypothetical protein KSP40_PGU018815 [Platanthera guangdongensis]|uniref:Uncharacterized protein n=1 Tax=Platanthera guangdongensis TaxID=2320717 RepID=A0ABR2MLJ5_9ASPA
MRCRIHPSAAGAGVCASCLRDRLSALSVATVEGRAGPASAIRKILDSSCSPPALLCPLSTFPDFVDQRTADQVPTEAAGNPAPSSFPS